MNINFHPANSFPRAFLPAGGLSRQDQHVYTNNNFKRACIPVQNVNRVHIHPFNIPSGFSITSSTASSALELNPHIVWLDPPTLSNCSPAAWLLILTEEEASSPCRDLANDSPSLILHLRSLGVPFPAILDAHLTEWLSHFISHNLTVGFAFAWAAALNVPPGLGMMSPGTTPLRVVDYPYNLLSSYTLPYPLQPLPSLVFDYEKAIQVDPDSQLHLIPRADLEHMHPRIRRIWDLASNKVIPFMWMPTPYHFIAISHAWTEDMELTWSAVNEYQWPVPLPHGIALEDIRLQLLATSVRFCWLDVLCLRQGMPSQENYPERRYTEGTVNLGRVAQTKRIAVELEKTRLLEWRVDVPTIGNIYISAQYVYYYLNGLGRPFDLKAIQSDKEYGIISKNDRHWVNRAWVMQETLSTEQMILMSPIKPVREAASDTFCA